MTNVTRPQIFAKSSFKGIFPHKGRRCAKLQRSVSLSARWVPVTGTYVLADIVESSQGYLPLSVIDRVRTPVKEGLAWQGQAGRGPFVWLHDLPLGAILAQEFACKVHQGASSWWTTIKAGSRVYLLDAGCPEMAARWWVVPPAE